VEGGFVPLHTAALNGDAEIVRLLLDHGADALRPTNDGKTPLDLAREAEHAECARLLEAAADTPAARARAEPARGARGYAGADGSRAAPDDARRAG
jgi:ankyrin repeat protein